MTAAGSPVLGTEGFRRARRGRLALGQKEPERRAAAGLAAELTSRRICAMPLTMTSPRPLPRPLSLGGEERLEDERLRGDRDPASRVGDLEDCVTVRTELADPSAVAGRARTAQPVETRSAAAWHRVAGVQAQVDS